MDFPRFMPMRNPVPQGNLSLEKLGEYIRSDPELERVTRQIRENGDKLQLPLTCLGGPYRQLGPDDDHGTEENYHDRRFCPPTGWRNTEHIDWDRRTGLVTVDIDDIPFIEEAYRELYFMPFVSVAWVSARGHGYKVGIAVDPVPENNWENHCAWEVAVAVVRQNLLNTAFGSIDVTKAAAHAAILAHDSDAIIREPEQKIGWQRRPRPRMNWESNLAPLFARGGIQELSARLHWDKGNRSHGLFYFGIIARADGWHFSEAEGEAARLIQVHALDREYGEKAAMRNFYNGWNKGDER